MSLLARYLLAQREPEKYPTFKFKKLSLHKGMYQVTFYSKELRKHRNINIDSNRNRLLELVNDKEVQDFMLAHNYWAEFEKAFAADPTELKIHPQSKLGQVGRTGVI